MTFTYDPGTPTDITRVRARVGDIKARTNDPTTGIRSDEEIQMWLDDEGSVGGACIAWVQSVLLELDQEPDSTEDWLEMKWESARESYKNMLAELKKTFGVSDRSQTVSTVKLWRSDTNQTDPN